MKERYITLVGMNNYYGLKPFAVGKTIKCTKDKENTYDSEAIMATMKEIGKVAYIANSPHTVVTGCMSAGRIYDQMPDNFLVQVMFITDKSIICKVQEGTWEREYIKTRYVEDKVIEKVEEYKYEAVDSNGSWIMIKEDSSYDEPDGFFHMIEKIREYVNGEIRDLGDDQYIIEGDELGLVYQWDSCFGITIVCPSSATRKEAIEFLEEVGILENSK